MAGCSERARIAVGENTIAVFQKRCAVRSHGLVNGNVFVKDSMSFNKKSLGQRIRRLVSSRGQVRLHAIQGPKQVHGGRPAFC